MITRRTFLAGTGAVLLAAPLAWREPGHAVSPVPSGETAKT